jgi:O-antigen/teichoic acid export membrane protein
MHLHWRFAKNAIANLGRGSAAAVVALVLPPILVRHMTPASYAVWVLVLQSAAYVSYLNLGLQTAIGRYIASAKETGNIDQRDSVFSTGFLGLCCAAVLAILCLVAATLGMAIIFPNVPASLIPQMQLALLLVGFSMAVELPASAWNGVFIGLERYEVPALTTGAARLLSALGIVAAALAGRSLVVMAAAMASANLISYIALYLALRRLAPGIHFKPAMVRRSTAYELSGYCFGLIIFSFNMLLVTGFDLLLVGRFQFSMITPFSISASMIALISGLLAAIINVIMPHSAALHAGRKAVELGKLVISTTRISLLLLILTGMPILIYAGPILRLWIGQRYVLSGTPILVILVIANIIRLGGLPYTIVLVAAGQQRYIKVTPLAEGFSNLAASVVLGLKFGAIGVAFGTLLGSFVSIAAHLFYSMARTKSVIVFSRREFILSGVLIPALCTSPLLAIAAASLRGIAMPLLVVSTAITLSVGGAVLLLLHTRGSSSNRDQGSGDSARLVQTHDGQIGSS